MDTKYKVGILAVSLVVAFAVGRYTVPETVRIETKIVEVEKKVKDIKKDKNKETKVTTIKKPDGTVETVKTITENTKTDSKSETNSETKTDNKSETIRGSDKVTLGVMGGFDVLTNKAVYGGSVYRPVLGPIGIGVWGLSNATCGATIGLSF